MASTRRALHRILRVVGATTLAVTAVISAGATPAQAQLSQCGTYDGNKTYFSGWQYASLSSTGASAEIPVRTAAVCDSDSGRQNFTNSWSMIAAGDRQGWVQSGYERWWGSSFYFFTQSNRRSGQSGSLSTYYDTSQPLAVGSVFRFWQQYDAGCRCMHSNVNTRRLLSTGWDPLTWWPEPFSPQFFSETRYTASDVPGSPTVRTDFAKLQYQSRSNGSWLPMPHGMQSRGDSTRWAQGAVNDQHVYSYTK